MIETQYQIFLYKLFIYSMEPILFILGGQFELVYTYILYHHASLPVLGWIATNYYPAGHSVFFMFANMLTHVHIYGYLALMRHIPILRMYNWQAFITSINIVQMLAIFIHGWQLFFANPCNYPMILVYITSVWGISIAVVFIMTWPFDLKKRLEAKEKNQQPTNIVCHNANL